MAPRMRRIAPYVIVLAIVSYLYFLATQIDFVAPGGRIGPNFWPKVILALAMLTCTYEIVKSLFFGKAERDLEGVLGSVLKDVPMEPPVAAPEEKTYPHLLWIGIAMTLLYVVVIDTLGFFLCTLIYLAAFMWIGRYRRIGVIASTSVIGSLAFMFMFMKIVYVSLPLGVGPFAQVSFLLMRVMGIR
jgi:putative tricarboxylic transport membrane protein